ncbi:sulfurtransferase TusA family protein [Maricurvus nonylphenolicus]|uniref:sulfurtransferase TusA family protein n=1 Tax=Maricurvus nonylphenolicus TaxID=1008307 RepID=UPI0036F1E81C
MSVECIAEIDASGLSCPLPLLKAKQGLNKVNSGECIKVIATDAGSVRDFHSFAELSGHKLVSFEETAERYIYILQKS